ncbi:GFA family protein [Rubellimicrobium roseum]|uniref:GFA family protein n=1 Tax=Rubellimicrobium roseum TaxID=687525 RepID=A0A5C4NA35_9RHOB|nr:GFA family protein [Rubellimicrobium roseum]TNC68020.1 GFA family protein [Rubellimicrobium roseum]
MAAEITGRCLCGDIRFAVAGPMRSRNHCHCESCRRATSSPFTTWFTVARGDLRWTGTPRLHESSPGVRRGFCPRCGSPLSYQTDRRPDDVDLYAASLDDPAGFEPQYHSHWDERVTWVALADHLPRE